MNFKIDKKSFHFKKCAGMILAATMALGCVPVNALATDIPGVTMEQQKGPQKGDITGNAQEADVQEVFLPSDGKSIELSCKSVIEIKEYDGEKWNFLDPAEYEGKGVRLNYEWIKYVYNPDTYENEEVVVSRDKTVFVNEEDYYKCTVKWSVNGGEEKELFFECFDVVKSPQKGTLRAQHDGVNYIENYFLKDGRVLLKTVDGDIFVEEFDGKNYVRVPEADYAKKGIKVSVEWEQEMDGESKLVGQGTTYTAKETGYYLYTKILSQNGKTLTYGGESEAYARESFYVYDIASFGEMKENETVKISIEKQYDYQAVKFVPETGGTYHFTTSITSTYAGAPANGRYNQVEGWLCDANYLHLTRGKEVISENFEGKKKTYEARLEAGKTYYFIASCYYPGELEITNASTSVSIRNKEAKLSKNEFVYTGAAMKPVVTIDGLMEGEDFTVSYKNNVNAGTATAVIKGKGTYAGTIEKTFVIKKATQSIKVSTAAKTVKAKKVRKKAQVTSAVKVIGGKGKVTYSKISGSAKLKINKSTGKITVKKKTRKGTYKIKVKVTAPTTANYVGTSRTVTVKVKVK